MVMRFHNKHIRWLDGYISWMAKTKRFANYDDCYDVVDLEGWLVMEKGLRVLIDWGC
jgi:hypothetical protein